MNCSRESSSDITATIRRATVNSTTNGLTVVSREAPHRVCSHPLQKVYFRCALSAVAASPKKQVGRAGSHPNVVRRVRRCQPRGPPVCRWFPPERRKRSLMSMSAQTLTQARETLIEAATQRLSLLTQLKEQGRKITELEREVQKLATNFSQAQQALVDARNEIEALRAQLPDAATINAYEALVNYMTAPAEVHPALRIAA